MSDRILLELFLSESEGREQRFSTLNDKILIKINVALAHKHSSEQCFNQDQHLKKRPTLVRGNNQQK